MSRLALGALSASVALVFATSRSASPPECASVAELYPQIWKGFEPLAAHGPITSRNVSDLLDIVHNRSAWEYYFVEVVIVSGEMFIKTEPKRLGPWVRSVLKLIGRTLQRYKAWVPDAHFGLSVLDDPLLPRHRGPPRPLLGSMTTAGHWDLPTPSQAFFEGHGGISSGGVQQDVESWAEKEWQESLARRYPWDKREERAFFRGHDWDSSNSEIDATPGYTAASESCISYEDRTAAFGYRRWYADLSTTVLAATLDVGVTGAPEFAIERNPNLKFVAPVPIPEHAKFKYLLHLDGTTCSNRLLKLLMLGSVVLKQESPYKEYFYSALRPYEHYVPFSRDRCSHRNLTAAITWLRENDEEARAIARRGQEFARRLLSIDAAACYWQRLLAVYGALQAFDPRLEVKLSDFHPWTAA